MVLRVLLIFSVASLFEHIYNRFSYIVGIVQISLPRRVYLARLTTITYVSFPNTIMLYAACSIRIIHEYYIYIKIVNGKVFIDYRGTTIILIIYKYI